MRWLLTGSSSFLLFLEPLLMQRHRSQMELRKKEKENLQVSESWARRIWLALKLSTKVRKGPATKSTGLLRASLLTHLSGLKKHLRWEAQRFQQSRWLVLDIYGLMWPGEPPWRTDNWRKKCPWAETWASKSDSILTRAHRKSSCSNLNLHMCSK